MSEEAGDTRRETEREAEGEAERIERQEFSRGHISPGEDPVEPRPASTLVMARPAAAGGEGGGGFRALLLRRPESSRFAAGAWVFPGGVIDAADGNPSLRPLLPPRHAAREPAALVAALREGFEETGLLPADRPPPREEARRVRRALLEDRIDFPAAASRLGLTFRELEAVYFARWITPEKLTRRYDTRFFLARAPERRPRLTEEHTEWRWVRPSEAVEDFREGRLPMLFPTWKTLEALSRFHSLDEAVESLEGREVEPIRARLEVTGDRVRPVMPDHPLYRTEE